MMGRFGAEPWLFRLLAITVLSTLSMNAVRPMVSYRALSLGASPAEVGLIVTSFSVLSVAAAIPVGRWVDRLGGPRVLVLGTLVVSIASLAMTIVGSLPLMAVTYAVMGLGQTVNLVASQTTVANRGDRAHRDERYALYTTAASIGQVAGPGLAGALAGGLIAGLVGMQVSAVDRETPVFLLAAICTGTGSLLAVSLARMPSGRRDERPTEAPASNVFVAARTALARPGMRRAMLVSVIVVSAIDVLVAYLPVYGERTGLSVGLVGMLLSVRAAAGLASRLLMARLLRWLGRRTLLTAGLALAAAGMLVLVVVAVPWAMVLAMICVGLGLGIGQPITISWVAALAPRRERATALAVRITGNRLALMTSPFLMGIIASALGVGATFAAFAGVIALGAMTTATMSVGDERQPRSFRDRIAGWSPAGRADVEARLPGHAPVRDPTDET